MKIKPLKHVRLHQMKFFWWDPKDDPREPEYVETPSGSPFLCYIMYVDYMYGIGLSML